MGIVGALGQSGGGWRQRGKGVWEGEPAGSRQSVEAEPGVEACSRRSAAAWRP